MGTRIAKHIIRNVSGVSKKKMFNNGSKLNTYSILPMTRTSKGPMKMVRVNECSSYRGFELSGLYCIQQ